ncbi:MAG TPA: hypothetical protein VLK85_23995, partial [Ramlibacter sp.]|nr:hypothetical protein [Ramlibacter sp.]
MRSRAILLVLAILLIAGFAALNWGEIIRPTSVWFGPFVADAPLGAILLGLLAVAVVIFAVSAGAMRTQSLMESRHHFKTLEAQRELADKAEASRFTELRQHLDTQLRELRDRDAIAATEFEKAMVQSQRELRTQLEQINRTIAARLTELEHRLDTRLVQPASYGATPVITPARDVVTPAEVREHAYAQPVGDAELREERVRAEQHADEARVQQERAREEIRRDERAAADRPSASGWR